MQQYAASRLLEMIPGQGFENVLEIGCGTGYLTRFLSENPSFRNILSTDISLSMIKKNRGKIREPADISFIAADASSLGRLLTTEFDLIISNSALHWLMDDFITSSDSILDILAPKGLFVASVFTNRGLLELKTVLKKFSGKGVKLPVDSFPDIKTIEKFSSKRLVKYQVESFKVEKSYKDMLSLMRALHRTGVAPLSRRPPVINSRAGLKRMEKIFYETYGSIKLSYEIVFFRGMKQ